ncbi:hypothetical protein AB4K20DRAFT_1914095 [Rhizopus microsporus]
MDGLQKCSNKCCSSLSNVSTADGVPWPEPLEPFRSTPCDIDDVLDSQYTHWCTLMRCLPLMDPVSSLHVKAVGLYAMREILKVKAIQKRETAISCRRHYQRSTLRDSMSWGTASQTHMYTDFENKMTLSPSTSSPIPPPLPPKEETQASTPCISPVVGHQNKFKKWIKHKALHHRSLHA